MRYFILSLFFSCSLFVQAQGIRVEPPNWFTGFPDTNLIILLHGPNISNLQVRLSTDAVKLHTSYRSESTNYLFLHLHLAKAQKAAKFDILLSNSKGVVHRIPYSITERSASIVAQKGFNPSDVLYLITPDRFANGSPENDVYEGQEGVQRKEKDGRHGGDIQGVIQHVDYLEDMGFTTLWLNPVLENFMPRTTYHGYAITDFYKVDPRFGTLKEYQQLSAQLHEKGMKLVMDQVLNHCGLSHWWMNDLPDQQWVHQFPNYTETNHRKTLFRDPYAVKSEVQQLADGWFVPSMPDLNQQHPLMAAYLIQNSLWWIETLGLDGIRMDTYSYSDKDFMAKWSKAIMDTYPNFSIVGEEWHENPNVVSYWQAGTKNNDGYLSSMPSMMDFPLNAAIRDGLLDKEQWNTGLGDLFELLGMDYLYGDAYNLMIFPDNHDMDRVFTQMKEDVALWQMNMAMYATMRGIPQFFYGTEILMSHTGTSDHGIIRTDFPGGWAGDTINAFTGEGLSTEAKNAQAYLRKLLNWRKTAIAIHEGKFLHYTPQQGIYVYFRIHASQTVMIVVNKNDTAVEVPLGRFSEGIGVYQNAYDVMKDSTTSIKQPLSIAAKTVGVYELKL